MDRNKMLENSKRIAKFLPSTSSKKFPNLLETEWNAGGKIRDRQIYLSESASNKERRDHEVSSRRASRPSIWHRGGGVSLFSVTRSAYGIFGECLVSERSAAAFGMPDSPREGDRKGCETLLSSIRPGHRRSKPSENRSVTVAIFIIIHGSRHTFLEKPREFPPPSSSIPSPCSVASLHLRFPRPYLSSVARLAASICLIQPLSWTPCPE